MEGPSGSLAMKHRSRLPGTGRCALGSNSRPFTCRLIFCWPNTKARRSTGGVHVSPFVTARRGGEDHEKSQGANREEFLHMDDDPDAAGHKNDLHGLFDFEKFSQIHARPNHEGPGEGDDDEHRSDRLVAGEPFQPRFHETGFGEGQNVTADEPEADEEAHPFQGNGRLVEQIVNGLHEGCRSDSDGFRSMQGA